MLEKENKAWWNARTLVIQIVLWAVLINGILAIVVTTPSFENVPNNRHPTITSGQPANQPNLNNVATMFPLLMGLFAVVGSVLVTQDTIIGETQAGTAAWVLSKPVSRTAFILAKVIANAAAIGIIIIAVQGALAYFIATGVGQQTALINWIGGLSALFIYFLFYITLTLMLGTFFNGRGPVIGIPLLLIFAGQMILGLAPWLGNIGPWSLVIPDPSGASLITQIMEGNPTSSLLPLVATFGWSIGFIIIAIWRFRRDEF